MASEAANSPAVRRVTLVMAACASAAVEGAVAVPGQSPLFILGWTAGLVGLTLLLGWSLHRRLMPGGVGRPAPVAGPPAAVTLLVLLGLLALPFVLEPVRGRVLGSEQPLELLMLASFRNLGLGLAALSAWPRYLKLAGLVSLFLVLFASSLGEGALVMGLTGAYVGAGGLWLMLLYWDGLGHGLRTEVRARRPVLSGLLVLVFLGSAFTLAAAGPRRVATVLAELLPTSGGTGGYDPTARGGLNDGDDEVRGSENASSSGFAESDVFLDTPEPSLYDAVSDTYGEPRRPQEQEQAVGLSPQKVREREGRVANNLQAGREFAAVREGPRRSTPPRDRDAQALLYIQGRTPLHLRMVAYDRFDGRTWSEAPYTPHTCLLQNEGAGAWMRLPGGRQLPIHGAAETHLLKVGLLRTRRVPAPAHLERFRVGKVNRPDFFAWAQEDILRFARRQPPAGTVVETEARTVDPRRLLAYEFSEHPSYSSPDYLALPDGPAMSPLTADLARTWAAEHPPGWARVQAVVAGLRARCSHDRGATVPEGCPDAVGHFLFTSRRGPDYLFASAAAVMLRSLGYPTRVVSGFYASPERYDPATGHTAVRNEDVHFWAEVLLPANTWVAIEPTPGYELLLPPRSWAERLGAALQAAGGWLLEHRAVAACVLLAAGVLFRFRREALDRLATWRWSVAPAPSWRVCVLRTLRLLDRRARWGGRPRPPQTTPARWYRRSLAGPGGPDRPNLESFLDLAEWALYAPAHLDAGLPYAEGEVRAVCRRAVHDWSLRRIRVHAIPDPARESTP
jgi:transglutaminase-like putative cysteine protease